MSFSTKKMSKRSKKSFYGLKLVLFSIAYFIGGYFIHNTLNNVAILNAVDRVNNCNRTQDIVICMNYYQPRGWEKLVRF